MEFLGPQAEDLGQDQPGAQGICRDAGGDLLKRLPVKNVSPETLIGVHPAFLDLPAFQLCLPFLPEEQNVIRLFELTADTT